MQHVDDVAHKSESLSLSERPLPSLAVCSASLNVVFLVFHPVSLLSSCEKGFLSPLSDGGGFLSSG